MEEAPLSAGLFLGASLWMVMASRKPKKLPKLSKEQVLALRTKHMSSSQSVSYLNTSPLMIMEGRGVYLIDADGTRYLDTRNNVAHCGHSHPAIVRAVQEQVATLNTNTRYLHPNITLLAQRLANLLPDPLEIVFFVNSGSEANDLALRLARACGEGDLLVCDHAYHGHTLGTLQVSPYKYEKGTEYKKRPPPGIRQVPCPNQPGSLDRIRAACASHKIQAWIVEGGMSVAGVVFPPQGFLEAAVAAVRQAGGLYIADEVQTGLGRCGDTMWAFQQNGSQVVPDIVTLGKPLGNGMPLAAVVTTRKVAETFEACGVEYFNTFGGNPVCSAAGLAVLDTMEEEGLVENAAKVGGYMKERFKALQEEITLIGDVRGAGLFLGVELVSDRVTMKPASIETSWVCSTLKDKYHILTSIDGPDDNVLVIKPPMVFSRDNVDYFVDSFARAIQHDMRQANLQNMIKTPT